VQIILINYHYNHRGIEMFIEKFDDNILEAICDILGDTNDGLTGSEIGKLLNQTNIEDIDPLLTKRYRLFNALSQKQEKDNCGNNIIAFIKAAMDPVRYTRKKEIFENRKEALNEVLALRGYELLDNGDIKLISKVDTISKAQNKANRLNKKLNDRNVHQDVLNFCRAELVADNYFHAVFEATKSVADKIRSKSGLTTDGADLIDKTFTVKNPILIINNLETETEKSEQKGFANLLKGVFGLFRNVTAHEPKIKWEINEQDALDLLTLVSYIHRRLDNAQITCFKDN